MLFIKDIMQVHIDGLSKYLGLVIIITICLRFVMSALKAFHRVGCRKHKYIKEFRFQFTARNYKYEGRKKVEPDYWFPTIIGLFELASYPILITSQKWPFIGAWLAFKTVAQWKSWEEDRSTFNRYLIGTALTLIISALIMTKYVKPIEKGAEDKINLKIDTLQIKVLTPNDTNKVNK